MTTTAPAGTRTTFPHTATSQTATSQTAASHTAPTHTAPQSTAHVRPPHAPVAAAIRHGYWRITAPDGRVLGNVEQLDTAAAQGDTTFVARRFHIASSTYLPLGRFHSMDDAVDAFRA